LLQTEFKNASLFWIQCIDILKSLCHCVEWEGFPKITKSLKNCFIVSHTRSILNEFSQNILVESDLKIGVKTKPVDTSFTECTRWFGSGVKLLMALVGI
jgi:hypothetical protein